MVTRVLLVVGAGPGLGAAVARRFGREGWIVELLARRRDVLARLASDLQADGIDAAWTEVDIADDAALTRAVAEVAARRGRIDVLHFNPSVFRHTDPLHLTAPQLLADLHVGAAALLTAVQAARPAFSEGSRVVVTGSMAADQPWHEACSLGAQKAALRNLVLSLDRALSDEGVRATSLTVNGTLAPDSPDSPFSPDRVADALYAAVGTPDERWQAEIAYDG
jgi:NAD(P)-dependent dehydrogenase (short-subunit alcohol dehydrogenase family)